MANWVIGSTGDSVAKIQRYLYTMLPALGLKLPLGFTVTGTYDATTSAALKTLQVSWGLVPTGNWNEYTAAKAIEITRYLTKGVSSDPFEGLKNTNTITNDRTYIIQQYNYLFDRPPTEAELSRAVDLLQKGMDRSAWNLRMEQKDLPASISRIFQTMLGREPTAAEIQTWTNTFTNSGGTRLQLTNYLAGTLEHAEFQKQEVTPPGAEDSKVYLENLLDQMGLGELKDWAWQQIIADHSIDRIIQDLRLTDPYKTRFSGLLEYNKSHPAKSEQDYLLYEQQVATLLARNGLPPSFYDEPKDFATLFANDLSIEELTTRVNDGYRRVMDAPIEIRQAFAELYGVDGDAALAALYIDPDVAEAALLKQSRAAETKGWGGLFGITFEQMEAERVAGVDLSTEQLRAGLGQLQSLEPAFKETISEEEDLTAAGEGAEAVFGLGGTGANEIERRLGERSAAVSGGGGASVSTQGVAVGSAK